MTDETIAVYYVCSGSCVTSSEGGKCRELDGFRGTLARLDGRVRIDGIPVPPIYRGCHCYVTESKPNRPASSFLKSNV